MLVLPESFHPIIRAWFTETYGKPTAVQARAWPVIERGENVLALAPTGSGKTLTAFLSAISRFCHGTSGAGPEYPADRLTVLYVSPLKALNEDIKRNLLEPLAAIRSRFENAGHAFPAVRVETRSGDTPQSERRRFLSRPPSILALTPESLAILLLNPKGRQVLSGVKYLILDEIHAVLGNKRGAYLSCQIDRLALVAGEFQRVSLSATVRPPETAAAFVAGLSPDGQGRPIRIVDPAASSVSPHRPEKQIEFTITYPGEGEGNETDAPDTLEKYGRSYTAFVAFILNKIRSNSTLLVFTDSRRRAERLSYFINQEAARAMQVTGPVAFPHHGSLAKELRQSVERRLAAGQLPCVVATASLELGIDIGNVDEVILAGSPGSVSQALQRIGRSGHSVGRVSRGILFPFHGMDLLLGAALKNAVEDRDIEETRPIENPLDILAQLVVAMCAEKTWNADELYATLRGFYVFRSLNKEAYNRTLRMLAGCGQKGRLRELKPRIRLDGITGEIGGLDGNLLLLYSSGGVIANRGLYSMRLSDGGGGDAKLGTKIGELDEEFVWERRIGDSFSFGGKVWRITAIGPESVEVKPLASTSNFVPFWRADTVFRSPKLTGRVLAILDSARGKTHGTHPPPRGGEQEWESALATFLALQQSAQGSAPLPGSGNITVEIIDSPESGGDFYSAVIHSFRGGTINYPFSLALSGELEETLELRVESFSSDDAVLFLVPRHGNSIHKIEEIFRRAFASLGSVDGASGGRLSRGERLFRNRLESSGVFGASFREAAERSLLIPKAGFGKRMPLWITRQRSKKLFDTVLREDGFPVTAEAWRSCLVDSFDMDGFRDLITALNDGTIAVSFFTGRIPSPFSRDLVWQGTNILLYETDERKDLAGTTAGSTMGGGGTATLSDKIIQEALGDAALRPTLKPELVGDFAGRLRRETPGWAPEDAVSLCEWVKERIAIPLDEWETLCASMPVPETANPDSPDSYLGERLGKIKREGAGVASVVHREWEKIWVAEALTLLGPWLRYEGPVSVSRISDVFGVGTADAEDAVNALVEIGEVVRDIAIAPALAETLTETSTTDTFVCDRENLEMLLRLSRRRARPEIRERPAAALVPFLALRQGLAGGGPGNGTDASGDAGFLKKLSACTAASKLWETELCTARCKNYKPEILDREIREGRLVWYGVGKEKIGVCPVDDLDLVLTYAGHRTGGTLGSKNAPLTEAFAKAIGEGFFDRPRDFWEVKTKAVELLTRNESAIPERNGVGSKDCAEALWQKAWQGQLSADSFEPIRRGIENGFAAPEPEAAEPPTESAAPFAPRPPRIPRALRNRWKDGAPVRGAWYSLVLDKPANNAAEDPFDVECRNRDRVRLLLARWGILCRPLFEQESPPFSWSGLLPAMRRMELSGELVAGRFFAGINSLQFASPSIAAELEKAESFNGIYWMNAADPVSPAGMGIEGLEPHIPARLPSNRLYFRGEKLIAVSKKNGRELHVLIDRDDQDIAGLVELFKVPRTRKILPENKLLVDKINDIDAARSGYAGVFRASGFVPDRGKLYFW